MGYFANSVTITQAHSAGPLARLEELMTILHLRVHKDNFLYNFGLHLASGGQAWR